MVDQNEVSAACAIKFLADLIRAAENDSSKDPMHYLKNKLGEYEKAADTILANVTYSTLDEWVRIGSDRP